MKRSKFTEEQILRSSGKAKPAGRWRIWVAPNGITEQTSYRWKAKYGGMELSEMRQLEAAGGRKSPAETIVAEQTLDIQALKAVVAKKW